MPRPANVHYWMSSKCIRPRKERGLRGDPDLRRDLKRGRGNCGRRWAKLIGAHRRAGHLIRQMLLQKIAETSLESSGTRWGNGL